MIDNQRWLEYSKKLQTIAQAGIAYSKDKYDIERFEEIQRISAEIFSHYTDMGYEKIKALFQNETGYPTPKVDVRAAIFRNNRILLVKEKIDGLWALPGGWAESNLSIKENLIKESFEEAGAEIKPEKVIAIHDMKKNNPDPKIFGVYKIFVECRLIDIEFVPNIETAEAQFFSPDALPPLSEGRNTVEQILMCFDFVKNEKVDVVFD